MKINKITLLSVVTVALASLVGACSSDAMIADNPDASGDTQEAKTVTLIVNQPSSGNDTYSRVAFDEDGKGYWQVNDTIGVSTKRGRFFKPFVCKSVNGETATFVGMLTEEIGEYAVYPYNGRNTYRERNILNFGFKSIYNYTSVDRTFFPKDKSGNSSCMPMVGKISEGNVVSFSHIGGVICLKIDKMPAERGVMYVSYLSNYRYTMRMTDAGGVLKADTLMGETKGEKMVTFDFSGATADSVGIFYLPVPVGVYDLKIKVFGDGKSLRSKATVEVARGGLQVVNVTTNYKSEYIINGHKFVDLGLPSEILWAETNIGAETSADYGTYLAWGETERTNSTFDISTYKYEYSQETSSYNKYNDDDGLEELEETDDAAFVNWGNSCRMPSEEEFSELTSNCTWIWTNKISSSGAVINGYEVVSETNGNSIFLPAGGVMGDDSKSYPKGTSGIYWSKNGGESGYGLCASEDCYNASIGSFSRYCGALIRPVAEVGD